MTNGWTTNLLDIDLTNGEIARRRLPLELLKQTLGGVGLAAQLIYDHVAPDADPLGPNNALVLAPGVLSGTTWAGTGRLVIAARSPLTGLWGEASLGGYFATQLKRAGYDALLVRGVSPSPVIIVINNREVTIEPAGDLWGQETYTAEDRLVARYPGAEVITIGPAGENLAPLASLVHRKGNDVAARCGLGAVAGSKRLKALVARGDQAVPVANEAAFRELKRQAIELFNKSDFIQIIRRGGGTASAAPIAIEMADLTAANWDREIADWGPEEAQKITGPSMQAQFPAQKDTCYACPVACKWTVQAPQITGEEGHLAGPEYESLAALGAQVLVSDTLAVIQAADLCNRLGLDTISTGATIAWALEAHQKGILSSEHIDEDLTLAWGEAPLIIKLIERMAQNRPGTGALLAGGSRRAAALVGGGAEFAIQVKGLELPFHHPRALRGLELAYATLPRGATHNEEGTAQDWDESTYEDWVAESIQGMNLSGANSSMVYCQFLAGALNPQYSANLLSTVTGYEYTPEQLTRIGERAWYLRRAFNLRLGVGLEADALPERITRQIKESHASLKDFQAALQEFHQQRQLDERGVPATEKLRSLGLDFLIEPIGAK